MTISRKIRKYSILAAAIILILFVNSYSGTDPVHVISHDRAFIVTDPSKGSKSYPEWAVFPSKSTSYRSVILNVTYRCPDSLRCGEWDYIDYILIRRYGGVNSDTLNLEIARMISPYGSRFGSDWKFTWKVDITDFSFMLHDSVEVEFIHTGYERMDDRGWLVTLDFELIPGIPPMDFIGMKKLWTGTFPYGNDTMNIEKFLTPVEFMPPEGSSVSRLRILQTGHGMDDHENCAEFCSKRRSILLNGIEIDTAQIWKECGDNPLFPQAGTWIFDRAGWCPGDMVEPGILEIQTIPGIMYKLDIDMQSYVNNSKPSANYVFSSCLFYYSSRHALNDAAVTGIISPDQTNEHSRVNPSCMNPKVIITNMGRTDLRSLLITCGTKNGDESLKWTGYIRSGNSDTLELNLNRFNSVNDSFTVKISEPNGMQDEYIDDNSMTSYAKPVNVYGRFVAALRTNKNPSSTTYRISNSGGYTVHSRNAEGLLSETLYLDTLVLDAGCYELELTDSAGDGLEFWFNPDQGYGFFRLYDLDGRLLKSFGSDFGNRIIHNFLVTTNADEHSGIDGEPIVNPFPARNDGRFSIDFFMNQADSLRITILDEKRMIVKETDYSDFKEGVTEIDISDQPDGAYYLSVRYKDKIIERRIRVKRE